MAISHLLRTAEVNACLDDVKMRLTSLLAEDELFLQMVVYAAEVAAQERPTILNNEDNTYWILLRNEVMATVFGDLAEYWRNRG